MLIAARPYQPCAQVDPYDWCRQAASKARRRPGRCGRRKARGRRSRPRSPASARARPHAAPPGRRASRRRPRRSPVSSICAASATVCARLSAAQHAVAADVGVDDRRDAGVLETEREVERALAVEVSAQPSVATMPSRASMPTAMRPGKARQASCDERGVLDRGAAQDDAADAGGEPCLDAGHVADAAAELHRDGHGGEDRGDRRGVDRAGRRRRRSGRPRAASAKPASCQARACAAGSAA